MKNLETERLTLRKFKKTDFDAVHRYASCFENVLYMEWGPNDPEQTTAFIQRSIAKAEENPCSDYQYAITLKESGELIGACGLTLSGDEGEIGWILRQDYWKQGYGSESGKALVAFGFETLQLRRIKARCNAENIASYRVMEKIGLRREGLFFKSRPAGKASKEKYGDELVYALLKEEWDTQKEILYYNNLSFRFEDFTAVPFLSDGEIYIVCTAKDPAIPEKKYVPAYRFAVCKGGEQIGEVNLRIGYTDALYYSGQVGYYIQEKYRGNGYAVKACRLLLPIAKAHAMQKLLITNNYTNTASKRVCEKLGAKLIRLARLPEGHELYNGGQRWVNIFEWQVGGS